MSFERLLKNPHSALNDSDNWVRLQCISAVSREPLLSDRIFFEELLENEDPIIAFLAYKGLTRLFPLSSLIRDVCQKLFAETVELLEKRASSGSGSTQIRTAALKALAFATDLSISVIESSLKSLYTSFNYDSSFYTKEPLLPLLQKSNNFFLLEGFGLLLASMPIEQETSIKIIKRELECQNPNRLIPAMISLQLNPNAEMTDQLLWIARNAEKRVSDEAIKALLACGGKKVYLVITSLLKEVAASTDREEIWSLLKSYAEGKDQKLALTALKAIDGFAPVDIKEKLNLYSELAKSENPELAVLSNLYIWRSNPSNSLKVFRDFLESDDSLFRLACVDAASEISPDLSIPLLFTHFEEEKDENVINQILLNARSLLPKVKNVELIENNILPWLTRHIASSNDFIRNQIAVLCGCLGPFTEDIVLKSLEKETHPYVIASLLASLGKCGCDKILLYSKYHDYKDARVRANMVYALNNCGKEAIPYFYDALEDESSRVRAGAAYCLFMKGQLDSIKVLNNMLQIPEPISVLSACYSIYNIFKIVIPKLETEHPLALAIARKIIELEREKKFGPGLLNSSESSNLFNEMAFVNGDIDKLIFILEERHKKKPSSVLINRLLASVYIYNGDNVSAIPLLEICVRENPTNLADLLDSYRTVLKIGDLTRANKIGSKIKKLYKMLFDGCIEFCKYLNKSESDKMLQQINLLKEPSMNLYNVMIQLKIAENDPDTAVYLMTELFLSRPFNVNLIVKLAKMMPDNFSYLKKSLLSYAKSLNYISKKQN